MPMYCVTLIETVTHDINVAADSPEEAVHQAHHLWETGNHDNSDTNHHGCDIDDAEVVEIQAEEEA